ncbi:hypothetical protein AAE478_005193 [Parahypoxylon ruwenzoriense]
MRTGASRDRLMEKTFVLRRSTTVASRRKVSAADLFTACYTTILGTATIIDAQRKNARKRELDEKLERARAASGSFAVQESPGQRNFGSIANADAADNAQYYSPRPPWWEPYTASTLFPELAPMCEITRRPLPRQSWIQTQLEWAQVEAAIVQGERDPGYILREPKTDWELQRTTAAVVSLVNRLLWQSRAGGSTRPQDNEDASWEFGRTEDAILEELRRELQTSHYPSYEHPSQNIEDAARTRFLLGESIRRIFNQASGSKEIVGKICYNLLTVKTPPSIHTYNTLIAGFNRIQRPDLAQIVVDSYFLRTAWPATQQTIVCLLNHYRATNNVEGMRDTIKRMRGVKDTGLRFRIISKDAIYTKEWLVWATENCASRKSAFVERARRGDEVFNSIIKGWLHYGEVGNACMVFIACLRNGGTVTTQTLQELFTACLAAVDFTAVRRLVRGFAKNTRRFIDLVHKIIHQEPVATTRQVVISLHHILDICWFPLREIFKPVAETYDHALQDLKSLVNQTGLEIEILETMTLYSALISALDSRNLSISRLDGVISTLRLTQQSRQRALAAFAGFRRLAMLLSIERRYRDLEARTITTTIVAKAAILKIKTGYDFDPSSLLGSKRPVNYSQRHRYDSLRNALRAIQIRPGPMTRESVRLQLVRNLPDSALARRFENSGNAENLTIRALTTFYAPYPVAFRKPKDRGHNEAIRRLERKLADTEETIKATLYAHLSGEYQRRLRFVFPNWNQMPLANLFKYHLHTRLRGDPKATGTQRTGVVQSCGWESLAIGIAEGRPPVRGVQQIMSS